VDSVPLLNRCSECGEPELGHKGHNFYIDSFDEKTEKRYYGQESYPGHKIEREVHSINNELQVTIIGKQEDKRFKPSLVYCPINQKQTRRNLMVQQTFFLLMQFFSQNYWKEKMNMMFYSTYLNPMRRLKNLFDDKRAYGVAPSYSEARSLVLSSVCDNYQYEKKFSIRLEATVRRHEKYLLERVEEYDLDPGSRIRQCFRMTPWCVIVFFMCFFSFYYVTTWTDGGSDIKLSVSVLITIAACYALIMIPLEFFFKWLYRRRQIEQIVIRRDRLI